MSLTHESTTVDAWLEWFATEKQAACRAYLCTRYRLDALDAEALINAAQLQVFLYWPTLENPLAYLWQTLKHAVAKQGRRRAYERQQLMAYAQQRRVHSHSAARTAAHIAAVLERVAPRQRRILAWYAQGYERRSRWQRGSRPRRRRSGSRGMAPIAPYGAVPLVKPSPPLSSLRREIIF